MIPGQPFCPTVARRTWSPPARFATRRNPIYLANMMLMAGLGCFLQMAGSWLLAPVNAILTQTLAIKREESHLIALFGYEYEAYCRRVRRWI
jgi:protein-S-isoprenylcysteine O-methyltransferase Ste14